MSDNQTLFEITGKILDGLASVLDQEMPDMIVVQGDTLTAFVGALAGYYKKIPVAHIEAGLRSHNPYSPFPEEINRRLVSNIATFHFVPTRYAQKNLVKEAITDNIWLVGNTGIDALLFGIEKLKKTDLTDIKKRFESLDFSKRIIVVTGHRRENFGKPMQEMLMAIREIALHNPDIEIVYPVHLNPNVQESVQVGLSGVSNIHLFPPVEYSEFIWLLNQCYLVITDSGGIQEEAPSLGKPVLITRDVTERTEGVDAGVAKLVGCNHKKIVAEVTELLNDSQAYAQMSKAVNPYGDGTASQKIVEILESYFLKAVK